MTKEVGDSELRDTWAANGGIVEPAESKIDVGFLSGERPAFQHMNWLLNLILKDLNYTKRSGIPEWNAANTYEANDFAQVSGVVYKATAQNTNDVPPSSNWTTFGAKNNLDANAAPTVDDDAGEGYEKGSRWIDNSVSPAEAYILVDPTVGAADWQNTTLTADDLGALAFKSNVSFGDLASSLLANLGEAEAGTIEKLITADILQSVLSGVLSDLFEVDLSADGYIKFGGLTIQWGLAETTSSSGNTISFPTAFSSACYAVVGTTRIANRAVIINNSTGTALPSTTGFPAITYILSTGAATSAAAPFFWIAVGQ